MTTNAGSSSHHAVTSAAPDGVGPAVLRPRAKGKFLFLGDEKFFVRGVTYGPFRSQPDGCQYPWPELVQRDFELMRRHGINAVRAYTQPPKWLLDLAAQHGLKLLIGLHWE